MHHSEDADNDSKTREEDHGNHGGDEDAMMQYDALQNIVSGSFYLIILLLSVSNFAWSPMFSLSLCDS